MQKYLRTLLGTAYRMTFIYVQFGAWILSCSTVALFTQAFVEICTGLYRTKGKV